MKANEAPEKIYIHPDIGGREFLRPWLHRPANNESVEYVRKDAFIEKVCKLLARMVWEVTYEDLEGNSVQHYDKMEFIEDFKKYMES